MEPMHEVNVEPNLFEFCLVRRRKIKFKALLWARLQMCLKGDKGQETIRCLRADVRSLRYGPRD